MVSLRARRPVVHFIVIIIHYFTYWVGGAPSRGQSWLVKPRTNPPSLFWSFRGRPISWIGSKQKESIFQCYMSQYRNSSTSIFRSWWMRSISSSSSSIKTSTLFAKGQCLALIRSGKRLVPSSFSKWEIQVRRKEGSTIRERNKR